MRASPEDMAAGGGRDDTRVVLLMGSLTYRARPFLEAAML